MAIHINRINFESDLSSNQQSHITETAMDNYTNFDYEVTNDTLEQLEKDIYKIYKEETKWKKLTGNEIIKTYIDFFVERGHTYIESASLIPQNDPTVLWIKCWCNTTEKNTLMEQ